MAILRVIEYFIEIYLLLGVDRGFLLGEIKEVNSGKKFVTVRINLAQWEVIDGIGSQF